MLQTLFGNKTAAQILLYLHRQKHGYAAQIARELEISLNMVQKQLARLAKGYILRSAFGGKNRVYQWNPDYPHHTPLRKFLASVKLEKDRETFFQHPDPADGTNLSLRDRVKLAESLTRESEHLNPYPRPRPFAKTFDSLKEYETWRKKQTNPWLV
ncbi:MAG: winged helix-turn-helix transcriptional regulator [Deltaproteobacteria bacterium]|nr:winged helix-turn-helix transcriptional regulator [Deltaproteobacteria bacterium]